MVVENEQQIWSLLEEVLDPEVPVLSVVDLGVVRSINPMGDTWLVRICPTYSGCPALDVIATDIRKKLDDHGIHNVVQYVLDEPWTSEWISEEGRRKLKAYGIAPPVGKTNPDDLFNDSFQVPCPKCDSLETEQVSFFGSTACKALYKCKACLEPFDHFKCK